jgi:DNA-binding transcriptional ArsR family regulator
LPTATPDVAASFMLRSDPSRIDVPERRIHRSIRGSGRSTRSSVVGDETRLRILVALARAVDDEGASGLSFSELRERVGVADSPVQLPPGEASGHVRH